MLARLGRRCLARPFSTALSTLPVPYYKRSMQFAEEYEHDKHLVSLMEYSKLTRKPDHVLVENWHRESAFDSEVELLVPIFNFKDGEYSGQCIRLDQGIFNLPLRRDIVHRVQVYESKNGQSITTASKTLANVITCNNRLQIRIEKSDHKRDSVRQDWVEEELQVDMEESRSTVVK